MPLDAKPYRPATDPAAGGAEGAVLGRLRRRRKDSSRRAPEAMMRSLPQWVWLFFGVLAGLGFLTVNSSLTAFAVLELPLLLLLLWRNGEPPALFFICVYQWLEASVAVFYTDYHATPLRYAANDEFVEATWLSLLGVLALAVGMRLGLRGLRRSYGQDFITESKAMSIPRLFNLYLVSWVAFLGLKIIAGKVPALSQPILVGMNIKWVIVILLMFASINQRRNYGLLAVMIGLETLTGVLGFFSGFKSVYFVFGVILLGAPNALSAVRLMFIGFVVALVLFLTVIWQAIKIDYREFLNQGTGEQVVLVSVGERIDKLKELLGDLDMDKIGLGVESGVMRLSYVQYFSLSLLNVPRNMPHEHGKLWGEAIMHILKPRILFPDKLAIDDSVRTAYYTGINVAGAEQGTSIGLGYLTESYIDFGSRMMFLPVAMLGYLAGFIYSLSVRRAHTPLIGAAFATAILMFVGFSLAQSNIKLVGGIVMSSMVLLLFAYFGGRYFRNLTEREADGLKPK